MSLYEGDGLNLTCKFTERNPFPSAGPYVFRLDEEIIELNVSSRISLYATHLSCLEHFFYKLFHK